MTTIALPRGKTIQLPIPGIRFNRWSTRPVSIFALASTGFLMLFLSYIALYHTELFSSLSGTSKALVSGFFIVLAPALALVFSIISLRRYVTMHTKVRGMVLAYISFFVSALYFVTALAMPMVLLGMYVVYVYVW